MRTDDLISQLSSDLKPVRPQLSPVKFTIAFSLFCLIVICAGLSLIHVRSDWQNKLTSVAFDFDLISSFGLMLSAMLMAGLLSSPGRSRVPMVLYVSLAFFIAIVAFGLLRNATLTSPDMIAGLDIAGAKCFVTVIVFSVLPLIVIGLTVKKRAALRPKMVAVATALACIAAGLLAITLHCGIDNAMHIALWHVILPIAVGVATGLTVMTKTLRW